MAIGTLTQPSFTFLLAFSILLSISFVALRHRTFHTEKSFAAPFDAGLAALIAGVVGARLFHVGLNWDYFATHTDEVLRLGAGGLNWHGAVICGGVAFGGMIHWHKLNPRLIWDSAAWCLPFIAFAAWWGCWRAACAFGAEVVTLADYPAPLVWEARDLTNTIAPRFATQPIGMFAAWLVWMALAFISWRGMFTGRRFPLALALLAGGMFALGYLRGDSAGTLASLRFDQWLDLALGLGAALWLARPTRHAPPIPAPDSA